ncbi:MAG: I78 family peptidase inhibitor [Alphaproteobacteria bacterium]
MSMPVLKILAAAVFSLVLLAAPGGSALAQDNSEVLAPPQPLPVQDYPDASALEPPMGNSASGYPDVPPQPYPPSQQPYPTELQPVPPQPYPAQQPSYPAASRQPPAPPYPTAPPSNMAAQQPYPPPQQQQPYYPDQQPYAGDLPPCDFSQWVGASAGFAEREAHATGRPYRIIGPGVPVTQDYSPARINIELDDRGVVVRISCG